MHKFVKIMDMEIPRGNSREDTKARRQIIKAFYKKWFSDNPNQVVRNKALHADIHVKYSSMNETSGRASASYESTMAVFHLSDILEKATVTSIVAPKPRDNNQKVFSNIYKMKYGKYKLVVGLQKSTGHLVQYYVGGGDKK